MLICTAVCSAQISYDLSSHSIPVKRSPEFAEFSSNEFHGEPGQPQLPVVPLFFLLPPDAELNSIILSLHEVQESVLSGAYGVRPAPTESTCEGPVQYPGRDIVNGKDIRVYSSNRFFPKTHIGKHSYGQLRDYKLVKVLYYPYRYNPVTRQLKYLQKGNVVITYDRVANHPKRVGYKIPFRTHMLLKQMVVNYSEMISEYSGYPVGSQRGSGYVIITTSAIESGASKLEAFIESKERRGFKVEVVTQTQWGGGTGNRGADEIRNWLVNNYQSKNIEYVLLIGNPDPGSGDVPMKNTYPSSTTPTDFYYCDLSSNWDKNGNGKCGEPDDLGSGGIDHIAEVGVGRIPVYGSDYQMLDHILEKTITYENTPGSEIGWRKKMLLAMKGYNAPAEGSRVGEAIKSKVSSLNSEWTYYRIYDDGTGGPELTGVSENFVLYAMESINTGLVEWMTHGSATEAHSVMTVSGTAQWDDEHPAIVFCGSCLNATPSVSNNLTYSLLKNGAVGAVGGTQTTLFSTGSDMETTAYNSGCIYQFGVNIAAGKMHAIDALNEIRATCEPSRGAWQNYVAYNLYGCPAIGTETNGDNTGIETAAPDAGIQKSDTPYIRAGNSMITVYYTVNDYEKVTLSLYSPRGQLLGTPVNTMMAAGKHSVTFTEQQLYSGFYLVAITCGEYTIVKRVLLCR